MTGAQDIMSVWSCDYTFVGKQLRNILQVIHWAIVLQQ